MENLGIDPKLLIAQIINFVIFLILIKKYISKPFGAFIEDEKSREKEKDRLLLEIQKKEEEITKRKVEAETQAKKETDVIIAEAKTQADKVRKDAINKGKLEADSFRNKARLEIESEKKKVYQQAKEKIADLSLFIVNKALEDSLDSDTQKKIGQRILKIVKEKIHII